MFDGLKRSILFGKLASGLEVLRRYLLTGESSGEKVLGWTVAQWKVWLEGGLAVAVGGALGAILPALTEYQTCLAQTPPAPCVLNFQALAVSAGAGALAALVGWFRMNPSDPRRTPEPPK
jgi:hypothetical protein